MCVIGALRSRRRETSSSSGASDTRSPEYSRTRAAGRQWSPTARRLSRSRAAEHRGFVQRGDQGAVAKFPHRSGPMPTARLFVAVVCCLWQHDLPAERGIHRYSKEHANRVIAVMQLAIRLRRVLNLKHLRRQQAWLDLARGDEPEKLRKGSGARSSAHTRSDSPRPCARIADRSARARRTATMTTDQLFVVVVCQSASIGTMPTITTVPRSRVTSPASCIGSALWVLQRCK